MANTYSKLVFHIVFAVKYRKALINHEVKPELEKYICGMFLKRNLKVLCINCMPDHVHLLISFKPSYNLDQIMKEVKVASTLFVRKKFPELKSFQWQIGYGSFSCNPMDLKGIFHYIQNQEQHHARKGFKQEFRDMLRDHDVEHDTHYTFDDPE